MIIDGSIKVTKTDSGTIKIVLRDLHAAQDFATIELNLTEYGSLASLDTVVPTKIRLDKIKYLGKQKTTSVRVAVYPSICKDLNLLRNWLLKNKQEPDWVINPHLDVGTNITYDFNQKTTKINYTVSKWIKRLIE